MSQCLLLNVSDPLRACVIGGSGMGKSSMIAELGMVYVHSELLYNLGKFKSSSQNKSKQKCTTYFQLDSETDGCFGF